MLKYIYNFSWYKIVFEPPAKSRTTKAMGYTWYKLNKHKKATPCPISPSDTSDPIASHVVVVVADNCRVKTSQWARRRNRGRGPPQNTPRPIQHQRCCAPAHPSCRMWKTVVFSSTISIKQHLLVHAKQCFQGLSVVKRW